MLINGVHALNTTQLIINAYTLIVALIQSWACYRIKQTAQPLPKGLLRGPRTPIAKRGPIWFNCLTAVCAPLKQQRGNGCVAMQDGIGVGGETPAKS